MNESPTAAERREEIESWWAFIARVLAFFLGAVILLYTIVFLVAPTTEKLAYVGVASGLMGPVVATSVAQVLRSMRGGR